MKHLLFFLIPFTFAWGKIILIDPGHGGSDLGTKGNLTTPAKKIVYEKDLALRLAKILQTELQKKHQVYLTRLQDICLLGYL